MPNKHYLTFLFSSLSCSTPRYTPTGSACVCVGIQRQGHLRPWGETLIVLAKSFHHFTQLQWLQLYWRWLSSSQGHSPFLLCSAISVKNVMPQGHLWHCWLQSPQWRGSLRRVLSVKHALVPAIWTVLPSFSFFLLITLHPAGWYFIYPAKTSQSVILLLLGEKAPERKTLLSALSIRQ